MKHPIPLLSLLHRNIVKCVAVSEIQFKLIGFIYDGTFRGQLDLAFVITLLIERGPALGGLRQLCAVHR